MPQGREELNRSTLITNLEVNEELPEERGVKMSSLLTVFHPQQHEEECGDTDNQSLLVLNTPQRDKDLHLVVIDSILQGREEKECKEGKIRTPSTVVTHSEENEEECGDADNQSLPALDSPQRDIDSSSLTADIIVQEREEKEYEECNMLNPLTIVTYSEEKEEECGYTDNKSLPALNLPQRDKESILASVDIIPQESKEKECEEDKSSTLPTAVVYSEENEEECGDTDNQSLPALNYPQRDIDSLSISEDIIFQEREEKECEDGNVLNPSTTVTYSEENEEECGYTDNQSLLALNSPQRDIDSISVSTDIIVQERNEKEDESGKSSTLSTAVAHSEENEEECGDADNKSLPVLNPSQQDEEEFTACKIVANVEDHILVGELYLVAQTSKCAQFHPAKIIRVGKNGIVTVRYSSNNEYDNIPRAQITPLNELGRGRNRKKRTSEPIYKSKKNIKKKKIPTVVMDITGLSASSSGGWEDNTSCAIASTDKIGKINEEQSNTSSSAWGVSSSKSSNLWKKSATVTEFSTGWTALVNKNGGSGRGRGVSNAPAWMTRGCSAGGSLGSVSGGGGSDNVRIDSEGNGDEDMAGSGAGMTIGERKGGLESSDQYPAESGASEKGRRAKEGEGSSVWGENAASTLVGTNLCTASSTAKWGEANATNS